LESGRSYYISVGVLHEDRTYLPPSYASEVWDPIRLRVKGEGEWPLKVGVLGDSGFGEAITTRIAEGLAAQNLDLVLHTGDLVYHAHQDADPFDAFETKFYSPLSILLKDLPLYPVLGNHEYDEALLWEGDPFYYQAFPPLGSYGEGSPDGRQYRTWYAYEYGPIQFLLLNSQAFYNQELRQEQKRWMEGRLQDEGFEVSIPVFHIPPYTSGLHRLDGRAIASEWVPIFEAYEVPLVLSGHDHNYERLLVNGITYVVSGGGSSVLYPISEKHPDSLVFTARSHYLVLSFSPSSITLEAYSSEGELIDHAIIAY
jgi:3',5'-cyclic AMP phosphodiesterase CpdA